VIGQRLAALGNKSCRRQSQYLEGVVDFCACERDQVRVVGEDSVRGQGPLWEPNLLLSAHDFGVVDAYDRELVQPMNIVVEPWLACLDGCFDGCLDAFLELFQLLFQLRIGDRLPREGGCGERRKFVLHAGHMEANVAQGRSSRWKQEAEVAQE
jgi:hypothetical protein